MATASSSSSTSSVDRFTYDVFLNFRGPDTRNQFIESLWNTLEDKGITTFYDKENIEKGRKITPELLSAIDQSRMALVVLSPDYATSTFCLEELSHILRCIRGRGRSVWPIFYEVEPSEPRWLEKKTSYRKSMDEHEAKGWYDEATLQKWKNALKQVADLSGTCTYFEQKKGGFPHEIIRKIVEKVSKLIKPFTLYVGDKPVGLDLLIKDVKTLLNLVSDDIRHMVIIHGIGGMGKTTLSIEVYNSIAGQFEVSSFLPDVRENLEKKKLIYLQQKILSDTIGKKENEFKSDRQETLTLQKALCCKKVLLVLDDVDHIDEIDAIIGKPEWFGLGSRIIITTRNTSRVTRYWVNHTTPYEMNVLNKKAALDLLRSKAFEPNIVSSSCDDDHL